MRGRHERSNWRRRGPTSHEGLPLTQTGYATALTRSSQLGLVSGVVYDTLHLVAAERANCQRLYTCNLAHFNRLRPVGITVTAP